MDKLIGPIFWVSLIVLASLFLSKMHKNKDAIAAIIFTISGVSWVFLLAIMLNDEVSVPEEYWKVIVLSSALMTGIISVSFECFGYFDKFNPEPVALH